MRLKLTPTDSNGDPVTSEFTVTVDGERYEFDIASTGTFRAPEDVGEHLLESDDYAVERHVGDADDDADGDDGE